MARIEGAEIVWTSADLAALQADKNQLQDLIDQIPSNPTAVLRTEFQDPCPDFVRWVVANSNDDQSPDSPALRKAGAQSKSKASSKGKKKPRKG